MTISNKMYRCELLERKHNKVAVLQFIKCSRNICIIRLTKLEVMSTIAIKKTKYQQKHIKTFGLSKPWTFPQDQFGLPMRSYSVLIQKSTMLESRRCFESKYGNEVYNSEFKQFIFFPDHNTVHLQSNYDNV